MRIKTGIWYFCARSKALFVRRNACSGVPGAKITLGNSPWPAWRAKRRSPCSVRVGSPVAGPGLWARAITMGVSVMAARERPSTMRAKPPPDVPVIARIPAKEAPSAILMAAISSSACSTITSNSLALLAM